jgi:hypothetical protein
MPRYTGRLETLASKYRDDIRHSKLGHATTRIAADLEKMGATDVEVRIGKACKPPSEWEAQGAVVEKCRVHQNYVVCRYTIPTAPPSESSGTDDREEEDRGVDARKLSRAESAAAAAAAKITQLMAAAERRNKELAAAKTRVAQLVAAASVVENSTTTRIKQLTTALVAAEDRAERAVTARGDRTASVRADNARLRERVNAFEAETVVKAEMETELTELRRHSAEVEAENGGLRQRACALELDAAALRHRVAAVEADNRAHAQRAEAMTIALAQMDQTAHIDALRAELDRRATALLELAMQLADQHMELRSARKCLAMTDDM